MSVIPLFSNLFKNSNQAQSCQPRTRAQKLFFTQAEIQAQAQLDLQSPVLSGCQLHRRENQQSPAVLSGSQLLHRENQQQLLRDEQLSRNVQILQNEKALREAQMCRDEQIERDAQRLRQIAERTPVPFSLLAENRQAFNPPGPTLIESLYQPSFRPVFDQFPALSNQLYPPSVPIPVFPFDDNRDHLTRCKNDLILDGYYDRARSYERCEDHHHRCHSRSCSSRRCESPKKRGCFCIDNCCDNNSFENYKRHHKSKCNHNVSIKNTVNRNEYDHHRLCHHRNECHHQKSRKSKHS